MLHVHTAYMQSPPNWWCFCQTYCSWKCCFYHCNCSQTPLLEAGWWLVPDNSHPGDCNSHLYFSGLIISLATYTFVYAPPVVKGPSRAVCSFMVRALNALCTLLHTQQHHYSTCSLVGLSGDRDTLSRQYTSSVNQSSCCNQTPAGKLQSQHCSCLTL